jgi:hypothetical protein
MSEYDDAHLRRLVSEAAQNEAGAAASVADAINTLVMTGFSHRSVIAAVTSGTGVDIDWTKLSTTG